VTDENRPFSSADLLDGAAKLSAGKKHHRLIKTSR
jgi:hypothetical protein